MNLRGTILIHDMRSKADSYWLWEDIRYAMSTQERVKEQIVSSHLEFRSEMNDKPLQFLQAVLTSIDSMCVTFVK